MLNVDSNIHIVGAASTEMSAVYRYLFSRGHKRLTLHDFNDDFLASLKISHRFYPEKKLKEYIDVVGHASGFNTGINYLKDIDKAHVIFAPQSWFIYAQNQKLFLFKDKLRYFIDICFDVFKGRTIGVTGTVGKSSTALYLSILTKGRLTGNDRENVLDIALLQNSHHDDIMVFEVSNRHLYNGFKRKLDMGVLTNICPNHIPDHGTLENYTAVKNSIFSYSKMCVYNRDNPYAEPAIKPSSKIECFSYSLNNQSNAWIKDDNIIALDEIVCTTNSLPFTFTHELENFIGACLAARLMNIPVNEIRERILGLHKRLKYRCNTYFKNNIEIVNDGASCLPENTRRLTESLRHKFVLITGGSRQAPLEDEFDPLTRSLSENSNVTKVFVIGPMKNKIIEAMCKWNFLNYSACDSLEIAVKEAVYTALNSHCRYLVFSPGCGVGDEYIDKYERGEAFEKSIEIYLSN